jgi:PKD repeat protein
LVALLAACGGGGGGGGGGGTNTPPQARFTATPTSGAAPLQVAFDGSGSTDAGGSIASYAWTFGDGGTGSGATVQHTYQATGTYTATLVVTDNQGAASAPATRTIEVRAPGTLAVTVRDDLNALVSGAAVRVTIGSVVRQGTTDASGQVTLGDLPLGSASIEVTKTGYVTGTFSSTVTAGQTTTVNARIVRQVGSLSVTVVENTLSDPIAGAEVSATSDGRVITVDTDSNGVALLSGIPTGTASITVTADGFVPAAPQTTTIVEGTNAPITVRLERATRAAAGFSGGDGSVVAGTNGTEARLTLRFVVIDENSQAITTLAAGDFRLQPCAEPANTNDCIRGLNPTLDGSYSPVNPGPDSFSRIDPVAGSPFPYSAGLLFDQSSSVGSTDPTDARIFAAKTFLGSVRPGGTDWASLGAFAEDYPLTNNGPFLLPGTPPLHIYPPGFTQDGASFYPDIDTFPGLESGDTPFYAALDLMVADVAANAPTQRKAVVVFSDAVDNDPNCSSEQTCLNASVAAANLDDVHVFTIGLSTSPGVKVEALAELANLTGGTFLLAPDASSLIPIYGSLGALLSGSLLQYETVWTVRSPTANAFRSGYFVSGKMDIDIGSEVITVPFVVPVL